MKMCQPHWDELRKAIADRGLSHLVAKDGKVAIERVEDELRGTATDKTYDPLMDAHWMISGKALEMGGLYIMGEKHDGSQYCPLCEVDIHAKDIGENAQEWIKGCTDSILVHCQERKLVPSTQ